MAIRLILADDHRMFRQGLRELLEQSHRDASWVEHCRQVSNPFGQGNSGKLIVKALATSLGVPLGTEATV